MKDKIKVGDFVRTKRLHESNGGKFIPEGSICKVFQKYWGIGIRYKGIEITRIPEEDLEKVTMDKGRGM
ncbi:MAG: hypothetical protein HQM10_26610 [Candidatus Riflebacteria bacterium]|nr:hypothetical protein [Candidatus Riflebacteria bacterium]